MNDDFAVDENGLTKDGYHVLSSTCKKAMYIRNGMAFAILTAILALIIVFSKDIFGESNMHGMIISAAIYALICIYLITGPQIFYRRYRYRITDDEVDIRRGIVTITHTMVPVERIHQVEVSKGPINRMFGLADVNITTAGGVARLEYLDTETAEGVAMNLNKYVVGLLRERDDDGSSE